MHAAYLLFFLSLSVLGETVPDIKVIPNPKTPDDYDHQFKGCPENSECDQVMGHQMQRWKDLVSKMKDDEMTTDKKAQFLELFRAKYGIPVEFYTLKKSQQGFRPLYFNSSCKEHNPKLEDQKTLRGTAFIKSLSLEKAIVWRDQAEIEVPTKELLNPQHVTVFAADKTYEYALPLDDQPLFIKNKELYILKEEDGLFFVLKVNEKGEWKIDHLDMSHLSEWEDKRQNVECPKDKVQPAKEFHYEFCKTVWDEDLKKTVIVKMHRGCSTQ